MTSAYNILYFLLNFLVPSALQTIYNIGYSRVLNFSQGFTGTLFIPNVGLSSGNPTNYFNVYTTKHIHPA